MDPHQKAEITDYNLEVYRDLLTHYSTVSILEQDYKLFRWKVKNAHEARYSLATPGTVGSDATWAGSAPLWPQLGSGQ